MVQKEKAPARRGRPRAYDPDTAVSRAMDTFWDAGYAATSLDDLSNATGMNRPSLYGAFGDKRALYLKALDNYRTNARVAIQGALSSDRSLREGLERVYAGAISIYLSGDSGARGCFMIGTASTEAVGDSEVRAALRAGLRELDEAFEARLRLACEQGELNADSDPVALAGLASAVLHTLAIRARAGERRAALETTAVAAIRLICGSQSGARKVKSRSRRARAQ